MIKFDAKFTNIKTGKQVEETHYFNINLAQLTEMIMIDGFTEKQAHIQELINKDDKETPEERAEIWSFFKYVISKSWIEFDENDEMMLPDDKRTARFLLSDAYSSVLKFLLVGDNEKVSANVEYFMSSLFPEDLMREAKAAAGNEISELDRKVQNL